MTEIIKKIKSNGENDIQSKDSLQDIKHQNISFDILQTIIRDISEGTLITYSKIENGFKVNIPLPDNRKQKVFVTTGRRDSDGEEIFQIFTICVKADPSLYEFALRMNMEIDYGALAIHEFYGEDYLVMVDTQLVKSAQPIEIEKSIVALAEIGDDIERILTGEDIR